MVLPQVIALIFLDCGCGASGDIWAEEELVVLPQVVALLTRGAAFFFSATVIMVDFRISLGFRLMAMRKALLFPLPTTTTGSCPPDWLIFTAPVYSTYVMIRQKHHHGVYI